MDTQINTWVSDTNHMMYNSPRVWPEKFVQCRQLPRWVYKQKCKQGGGGGNDLL